MTTTTQSRDAPTGETAPRIRGYVVTFVLAVALTVTAYVIATTRAFDARLLLATIVGLALVQFVVHLVGFLHLGTERKPRWKLYVTISMVSVVILLMSGTLWILTNLNGRTMIDKQQQYMNSQGGGL